MKIIITESQYNILSNSLRRRLTPDDFKYFDKGLVYHIDDSRWEPNFNRFSYDVISNLINDFITETRSDEFGRQYDENSFYSDLGAYSDLIPVLEKRYKNRLYQAWKVKGRSR